MQISFASKVAFVVARCDKAAGWKGHEELIDCYALRDIGQRVDPVCTKNTGQLNDQVAFLLLLIVQTGDPAKQ